LFTALPRYIRMQEEEEIKMYRRSLQDGKEKYRHIRVIFLGNDGVGKTTLCKYITERQINLHNEITTNGADIYTHMFEVDLISGEWNQIELDDHEQVITNRIGTVIATRRDTLGKIIKH